MTTSLLAKPVAQALKEEIRERALRFKQESGRAPGLAVILVGEDPGSVIYTSRKGEAAVAAGIEHQTVKLPGTATPAEVKAAVDRLNRDPSVDGILIQRPLPKGFREEEVVYWVAPEKDVDAFHPENTGRMVLGLPCFLPCTPAGIMEILKFYKIELAGKTACVIGRSSIVGKPMASLLLQADATVLHCHSKTRNIAELTRQADVVVVAVGRADFINETHLREGAVVIDVGMNRLPDGKVVGDVAYERAITRAGAITPVPGGVGPMTITMLLKNTVTAAERRQ